MVGPKFDSMLTLTNSNRVNLAGNDCSIEITNVQYEKPSNEDSSYRPISLLSTLARLLETLLLPTMTEHLKPPKHQHGFHKMHSITTYDPQPHSNGPKSS